MSLMTMIPSKQRGSETTSQEFQHSLRLLDVISSWHLWGGALIVVFLPGTIILLSSRLLFAQLGPFHELSANLFARGVLSMMWLVSAVTLYQQRLRLKLLRKGLIEQMDAATKNCVRAEQFYGMSILDPLTGLYNRRFGETRLEEEIVRASESDDPLLVLALDFNRFKEINDTYGHAAGDLALKEFSRRLQRAVRACDVPIRLGGDEFLVILPECSEDKIKAILSRMASVAFNLNGKQIAVSFSHGMARYEVNDTRQTMIKRADERLYAEKAKRKAATGIHQAKMRKSLTPENSEYPSNEPPSPQRVAGVRPARIRRSGRIRKEIAIVLIGSDLLGKVFTEQTNTFELSRHGAGVVSRHKLAAEQEVIIRRQDTDQEALARVVRVIRSQSENYAYGLEFMSSNANVWGVELPPESGKEASRSPIRKGVEQLC